MKKIFPILVLASLLVCACKSNQKTEDADTPTVVNTTEVNPNAANPYISDTEAEDADVIEEDLSGQVVSLSASDFIDRVVDINNPKGFSYKGRTPCVVDFYADWCRPCIGMKPVVESMAKKYKGKLIVYKVNVDKAQDVCQALGIQNIPTFIFFSRTEQPRKLVGAMSASEFESAITDFLGE